MPDSGKPLSLPFPPGGGGLRGSRLLEFYQRPPFPEFYPRPRPSSPVDRSVGRASSSVEFVGRSSVVVGRRSSVADRRFPVVVVVVVAVVVVVVEMDPF